MKAKDKIKKIQELLDGLSFTDSYVTKTDVLKEMEGYTLSEIAEIIMGCTNTICGIHDILEEE